MQKFAATTEGDDNETRIVVYPQMSDYFLKKIVIKWNTLNMVQIKLQPQYK